MAVEGLGHREKQVPLPSVPPGSTPKSKAASASDFSEAVNSSFSESDCLGFKTRSSACFWNPASVDKCLLLLDVSKEGSMIAWEKERAVSED